MQNASELVRDVLHRRQFDVDDLLGLTTERGPGQQRSQAEKRKCLSDPLCDASRFQLQKNARHSHLRYCDMMPWTSLPRSTVSRRIRRASIRSESHWTVSDECLRVPREKMEPKMGRIGHQQSRYSGSQKCLDLLSIGMASNPQSEP